MRLYTRLMRGGDFYSESPDITSKQDLADAVSYFQHMALDAVLVDVQNVVSWIDSGHAPRLREITGVLPPWEISWCEWGTTEGYRVGILTQGTRIDGEESKAALEYSNYRFVNIDEEFQFAPWIVPDDGYAMLVHVFHEAPSDAWGVVMQYDGFGTWMADRDGNPVLDESRAFVGMTALQGDRARFLALNVQISISAFALANCRNVERVETLPTRQQRRESTRRGEPVYSYYVLRIDEKKQIRARNARGEGDADPKRLHICRGHFATYTDDAPLFGKHTGRFWIPMHVRGNRERGVIVKDYDYAGVS